MGCGIVMRDHSLGYKWAVGAIDAGIVHIFVYRRDMDGLQKNSHPLHFYGGWKYKSEQAMLGLEKKHHYLCMVVQKSTTGARYACWGWKEIRNYIPLMFWSGINHRIQAKPMGLWAAKRLFIKKKKKT